MTQTRHKFSPLWWFPLLAAISLAIVPANALGMGFGGGGTSVPTLTITPGPMASPVRIDLGRGSRGRLLVTDYARKAVCQVDRNDTDTVKPLFVTRGRPLGIAQASPFLVFVGNETSGNVELYTTTGRLLRSYRDTVPMVPTDLAFDLRSRWLFVADSVAGNVKIFSLTGRLVQTIDGSGELFHPMGVAIDAQTRRFAVTDFGDPDTGVEPSIQLFDYSGARLLKITGAFSSPRGVAIAGNRLFMVDALLGQVLVFDATTGQQLGAISSFGTDPGQLLLPLDVAWDEASQTLFITNNRLGRVTALTTGF